LLQSLTVVLILPPQTQNGLFIQSRQEDPSVKAREHALQALDLAYHKYREIIRNLEEGMQVWFSSSTLMNE
jgi:programmed cell death 6-interacting protein